MWAMSTNRSAPTPWAISAMRGKSRMRGYADAPATTIFGPDLLRDGGEGVVVDPLGRLVDAVRVDLVQPAGEVDRRAVGQVAAVGQVHAQDPVARLEHAEVGGHVGLRAGVGLDVDVLGAREERQRALLGERLGDVHVLAAAVVALARQALGVLVREPRALGLHHRGERVVLAGDELDLVALPVALLEHRGPELGVDVGEPSPAQSRRLRGACQSWVDLQSSHGPLSSHFGAGRRLQAAPDGRLRDRAVAKDPRCSPVRSTTVDASPPADGPPSRIRSIASPSSASISSASRASGSPDRLAEVVGSGPSARRERAGRGVARDAQPDRRDRAGCELAARERGGSGRSAPAGHDEGQAAGPERAGERGRGRVESSPISAAWSTSASRSAIALSGGRDFAANRRSMPPGVCSATAMP